jgi:hypothetical protein
MARTPRTNVVRAGPSTSPSLRSGFARNDIGDKEGGIRGASCVVEIHSLAQDDILYSVSL